MSRARHNYPVASTSYHHAPSDPASRRQRASAETRRPLTSAHPDFSQDIYIPESQEELNRVSIESRLLQPSGPKHNPDMRRPDLTSASSTFDTYDRIGRDDDLATAPKQSIPPVMPAQNGRRFDPDESLIPGVGRGVRSTMPSQTSYQERMRSLHLHAAQDRFQSSPSRSPYRPGKYSSAYPASSTRQHVPSSSLRPSAASHAPNSAIPRPAHVESESESDADSATDSADSDRMNVHTATFNSAGNHRNFAATPVGHTATMTTNFRQRPTLGQDTLDRIEFDLNSDADGDHRSRKSRNSSDPTYTNTMPPSRQQQQTKPRPDPTGPFASPRATNTFGMNAADYQQHLASRTLTSPALRTLIGDRSKSPDSPTPAPSIDGVLHAGKPQRQQPRATRPSSVSAFEDLARTLQRDVERTRARADDADDGSASNSGGSGFGPGSQASSARTRVDVPSAPAGGKAYDAAQFNIHGYLSQNKAADATSPWGVRLPDVTGLTSALGSPVRVRDAVKHRPFDSAVGNQEARMEEIVNLRCFVDGIQIELDRAGERILNLEQAQEQQSHEFQGLRSEMQNALKDVRATQPADSEQLVQMILQKLSLSSTERDQQRQKADTLSAAATAQARQPRQAPREARAPQQDSRSQVEVVNRLYAELDKLRSAMEEQYLSAAGLPSQAQAQESEARPQHTAYRHQDNLPSGHDPWEAIEALSLQVLSLADEVEGLNGLVLDHLVPAPKQKKRSARHRLDHDVQPASEPNHAHGTSWRRERVDVRTDPIDVNCDDHYHRRVSFHHRSQDDEYDRTLDAVTENLRLQRERQQRRHQQQDMEEAEISQLAESRAARAASRISCRTQVHDSRLCTVCSASLRSKERKASRRARLLAAEQRREAVELEESILLETLESPHGGVRSVGSDQVRVLGEMLAEHWDEFLHQRMLYSELADELKTMSPAMSKTKRTILAQHVLEAVEALELKADRIERLDKVLSSLGVAAGRSEQEAPPSPVDGDKVAKEPGSRIPSAGSARGGNRLKHAMESFERRSRTSPRMAAAGRNSPPTTIQL